MTAHRRKDGTFVSDEEFDALAEQLEIAKAVYRIKKGLPLVDPNGDRYDESRWVR